MKYYLSILLCVFSVVVTATPAYNDDLVPIGRLDVTLTGTKSVHVAPSDYSRIVAGHRFFAGEYWCIEGFTGGSTFAVPLEKKYASFRTRIVPAFLRVSSLESSLQANTLIDAVKGSYSIEGDRKVLIHGTLTSQSKPVDVNLDVSQCESLTIRISDHATLLDPVVCRAPTFDVPIPTIISPRDGATERGHTISLSWSEVRGAGKYAVIITATRITGSPANQSRVYAFSSISNSLSLDAQKLPDGDYTWQVLSLSDRGVIGQGAPVGSFVLARDPISATRTTVPAADSTLSPIDLKLILGGCVCLDTPHATPGPIWWPFATNDLAYSTSSCVPFYTILELPPDASKLVLTPDPHPSNAPAEIYLDGVRAYKGAIDRPVQLDVSGNSSLALFIPTAACMGLKGNLLQITMNDRWNSSTVEGVSLRLFSRKALETTSPEDKTVCPKGNVWFRWNALADADHYELKMIPVRLDQADNNLLPSIYGMESSEYSADLSTLPSGWYEWQVLAFGDGKVLGTWSKPIRIKLAKAK